MSTSHNSREEYGQLFPSTRAEISRIIWRAPANELLEFIVTEGLCTQDFLLHAMQEYNRSIENNVLMRPYATLEESSDNIE